MSGIDLSWSVSSADGDDDDADAFVSTAWAPFDASSPRPPLSLELVNSVIKQYTDPNWIARAGQFEVVSALWDGSDVVCSFPTSAGKTLIMMLGPLLDCHFRAPSVWVVCQPLEALRKTTVAKVQQQFFASASVSVTLCMDAMSGVFDVPVEGVTVIFCSPEQLSSVIQSLRHCVSAVHGLLVDEVHLRFCWDFRDYTPSDTFSSIFPGAVIGVFSATLSPERSKEVVRLMGMRRVALFTELAFPALRVMKSARWDQFCIRRITSDPNRLVTTIEELFSRLAADLSIIVFASSYAKLAKLVEPLMCATLLAFGPRFYCASYLQKHKDETCAKLKSGECRLVGSTCALGAGVDLPNVGAIVFFGCPKTLCDAAQGMGRAGRGQGLPLVEVVFAVDSASLSKVDNQMRLLMGYCPELKSKILVQCSLCEARKHKPASGSIDAYQTCFDFVGEHCGRPNRPACKRTMCKVFDGLLAHGALFDGSLDCGACDACVPPVFAFVIGSLVKYDGRDAVVTGVTGSMRYQIRDVGTGKPHAVAGTSLALVSVAVHDLPQRVEKNKLKKGVRLALVNVLRERFREHSLANFCLLSSVPSDCDIANMSRWTPAQCVRLCPIRLPGVDMQQWFESAQTEAQLRAAAAAAAPDAPATADDTVRQFVLPATLSSFMERFTGPLREAVLAHKVTGKRDMASHKEAKEGITRGTQSLGGGAELPKDPSAKSSRKRRSTIGGTGNSAL